MSSSSVPSPVADVGGGDQGSASGSTRLDLFLEECLKNLQKLADKGLFPYNIKPVISILEKIVCKQS